MNNKDETAILAGGCFLGVQELLRRRDGVISTRVGYTGGENDNPTCRNHPGHAEAVEIVFDPERISYRDILEFFFQIHDPTTKDRQGNGIGSDYRSEILATSDEQRGVAEETIADVDASGLWPGKVVTEISEAVPSGRPRPSTGTTSSATPTATTATFRGRAGSCRTARPPPDVPSSSPAPSRPNSPTTSLTLPTVQAMWPQTGR
jgi:peptide-methionine (S)-S-oxide reductase